MSLQLSISSISLQQPSSSAVASLGLFLALKSEWATLEGF